MKILISNPDAPHLALVCYSVGMWIVDHEVGGPSLCLAVLHLASAEDRFSWGVLPLRVNAHYSHKYNNGWSQG